MQDIRNIDGRKVCQVDERCATVEIRRKDCITQIRFLPDGKAVIKNSKVTA